MRWPLNPPKKNKRKQEKKTPPPKKKQKYPKLAFQLSEKSFPFFWVAFQNFPFLTPWPKKRAPKKHYKNRAFRPFFLKSSCASRNGHFWTKKAKIHKFQLSFFCLFLLLQQQKNPKVAETPILIVFKRT